MQIPANRMTPNRTRLRQAIHGAVKSNSLPVDALSTFDSVNGDELGGFIKNARKQSRRLVSKGRSALNRGGLKMGLGASLGIGLGIAALVVSGPICLAVGAASLTASLTAVDGLAEARHGASQANRGALLDQVSDYLIAK
jgi:hypothetical protein